MSKNKGQHYIPAFYLYNFTNVSQQKKFSGKPKRKTPLWHYDFNKNVIKERPIEKLAKEPYLLSHQEADGGYNHSLYLEVQKIESIASLAML